jgi:HAD superfamily hydrolase (TIGR01490 family)
MGAEVTRDYTDLVDEPQLRSAAFFDLDRTLIRGSSLLAMVRPLYRHGYVQRRTFRTSVFRQAIFSQRGYTDAELQSGADRAASMAGGLSAAKLEQMARVLVPRVIVPRIYPQAEARLRAHRARGELIFVISSAPYEIVDPFAQAIGADDHASTIAESIDGAYTGRIVVFMHGAAKAVAITKIAALWNVDLKKSSAYADSKGDTQMLELVGNPFCVNPDRGLRAIALERDWPCLRFGSQRDLFRPSRQELRRLTGKVLRRTPARGAVSGLGR